MDELEFVPLSHRPHRDIERLCDAEAIRKDSGIELLRRSEGVQLGIISKWDTFRVALLYIVEHLVSLRPGGHDDSGCKDIFQGVQSVLGVSMQLMRIEQYTNVDLRAGSWIPRLLVIEFDKIHLKRGECRARVWFGGVLLYASGHHSTTMCLSDPNEPTRLLKGGRFDEFEDLFSFIDRGLESLRCCTCVTPPRQREKISFNPVEHTITLGSPSGPELPCNTMSSNDRSMRTVVGRVPACSMVSLLRSALVVDARSRIGTM